MYLRPQTRKFRSGGIVLSGLGSPWKQFEEQVINRYGNGRYSILLRPSLGRLGAGLVTVAPSGGTAASAALSAASGASLGVAVGGPIGAGIGAIVGIITGAWAAHAARAKGATTENAAVASAVTAFDTSLQAVVAGANSGQITGAQAAQLCQTILQNYWQGMAPYQVGPGRADASHGGTNCGGTLVPGGCSLVGGLPCNSTCTTGCCVGCGDLMPTILQAITAFNSPSGGTITACTVYGGSYGYSGRPGYSLTYTPPAATTVAGAANVASGLLTNPVATLSSGSVDGIPLWAILAGAGLAIYALAG
jgi:hypothetical protein